MRSNQAKNKKRISTPVLPVSRVLASVGKSLNLDQKVQEWSVLSLWPQVVDEPFRTTSRAVRIQRQGQQNQLLVQVDNASVAAELAFHLEDYLGKIADFAPQTGIVVHRIELRVYGG